MIYKNAKGFIFPVPAFRDYLLKFSSDISSKPMIELMNGVSKNFIYQASFAATKRPFPDKSFTIFASIKPTAFIIFLT